MKPLLHTLSDEELMVHVRKHDPAAFTEIYARYSKRLYHFMLKMLNHDEEKARDLLQDLFLKIAEKPALFDPDRKFHTWIFTIAANACRTSFRHKERYNTSNNEKTVYNVSEKDNLIGRMDAGVFSSHLGHALEKLSYAHRETFVLRFQEEFSLKEIADVMHCSEGTVKSRIYYATQKLAEELREFESLLKTQ